MFVKWSAALVSLIAIVTLCVGSSLAGDDKEPNLEKIMESVNKANNTIRKNVRTAVSYKKGLSETNKAAKELLKLAKESKKDTKTAVKQKKEQKLWVELSDKFIETTEELIKVTEKDSQPDAKAAFAKVTKSCTDCHNAFRVEEDPFE